MQRAGKGITFITMDWFLYVFFLGVYARPLIAKGDNDEIYIFRTDDDNLHTACHRLRTFGYVEQRTR